MPKHLKRASLLVREIIEKGSRHRKATASLLEVGHLLLQKEGIELIGQYQSIVRNSHFFLQSLLGAADEAAERYDTREQWLKEVSEHCSGLVDLHKSMDLQLGNLCIPADSREDVQNMNSFWQREEENDHQFLFHSFMGSEGFV